MLHIIFDIDMIAGRPPRFATMSDTIFADYASMLRFSASGNAERGEAHGPIFHVPRSCQYTARLSPRLVGDDIKICAWADSRPARRRLAPTGVAVMIGRRYTRQMMIIDAPCNFHLTMYECTPGFITQGG